jgi:hypothetical protein
MSRVSVRVQFASAVHPSPLEHRPPFPPAASATVSCRLFALRSAAKTCCPIERPQSARRILADPWLAQMVRLIRRLCSSARWTWGLPRERAILHRICRPQTSTRMKAYPPLLDVVTFQACRLHTAPSWCMYSAPSLACFTSRPPTGTRDENTTCSSTRSTARSLATRR